MVRSRSDRPPPAGEKRTPPRGDPEPRAPPGAPTRTGSTGTRTSRGPAVAEPLPPHRGASTPVHTLSALSTPAPAARAPLTGHGTLTVGEWAVRTEPSGGVGGAGPGDLDALSGAAHTRLAALGHRRAETSRRGRELPDFAENFLPAGACPGSRLRLDPSGCATPASASPAPYQHPLITLNHQGAHHEHHRLVQVLYRSEQLSNDFAVAV